MRNLKLLSAAAALAPMLASGAAQAQGGADSYIASIMWTGATFCPTGWAAADGQLLSISPNTALFSLIGTTYGGNGQTTFALPDLRGRVTISDGQGPGLSLRFQGESFGKEIETLSVATMPAHSHTAATNLVMRANSDPADAAVPTGNVLANSRTSRIYAAGPANVDMGATSMSAQTTVQAAGSGVPFNITQPVLVMQACIALQGVYPPRP